jgi:hypothetical protein
VIRNVVVHISNEQPLLTDLYDVPNPTDAGLLCTNLRSMDGKRPIFIDRIENSFFFPYHVIRFLEIPSGALEGHEADGGRAAADGREAGSASGLRSRASDSNLPAVIEPPTAGEPGFDVGDEIDEDFLRRIRDA